MTPDERNQFYDIFIMSGTSLKLIINRAKKIQASCNDKHIYHTTLKKDCHQNATDILNMAESIKKRAEPALTLIEKQRQTLTEDNHEKTS